MSRYELDARRLLCPMPVIRTQDRVKQLQIGDVLSVTCTDPGVMQDIPAWCRINGHKVLETQADDYQYIIMLEVGE
ncbi:sulfurtransferase TusA family protein [methanotrophic endosymbiont of Bathymodiolus puteoserpentis (Logatchev)]|jgi:tRNA 2-thiouridine synthesizing protein A|uniref:sulfurtransferase TusA family protein n=1 Tax=methanotrophic endosymbiont of Bathymodiolus puteoserpentis (Logatchev) TaxID=343235 RepID=UPI0013C8B8E8|nr:sulfurtransferase TusA family protein [methanotrophic endosymbiont of Bathymodiolus puteoserpentis (Logatchev)]SHE21330.1 Rhodanese-like domain protein [methanotrophic endosymbiont of Bathymodiolus puteoserpentis (Logatchev)]